jgi:hypothetical protein
MTQAQASEFDGATDILVFTTGTATLVTVTYVAATATQAASVNITYAGKTLNFDIAAVGDDTNLAVFPDGSELFIGDNGTSRSPRATTAPRSTAVTMSTP